MYSGKEPPSLYDVCALVVVRWHTGSTCTVCTWRAGKTQETTKSWFRWGRTWQVSTGWWLGGGRAPALGHWLSVLLHPKKSFMGNKSAFKKCPLALNESEELHWNLKICDCLLFLCTGRDLEHYQQGMYMYASQHTLYSKRCVCTHICTHTCTQDAVSCTCRWCIIPTLVILTRSKLTQKPLVIVSECAHVCLLCYTWKRCEVSSLRKSGPSQEMDLFDDVCFQTPRYMAYLQCCHWWNP